MAKYTILKNDYIRDNDTNSTFPTSPPNRFYKAYLQWVVDGGVADVEVEPIKAVRGRLRDDIEAECLRRVALIDDDIAYRHALDLMLYLWPGISKPSLGQDIKDVHSIAMAAKVARVSVKTLSRAQVAAYDVVNDPNWPVL